MFKNQNKKIKSLTILIVLAICFLGLPYFVFATTSTSKFETLYFTPQIEIPNSGISGKTSLSGAPNADGVVTSNLLGVYIKAIYNYGLSVAGILAAIVMMAGGIMWLTSGGDSGQVSKAKSFIGGSLVGLFLLFGTYIILNTVNPLLVELKELPTMTIKSVVTENVYCCHPQKGLVNISVKKIGDDLFYADSRNEVGGKIKEEGTSFSGCWNELASEDCKPEDSAQCIKDDKLKSYVCINPKNKICCTCTVGDNWIMNRYTSCRENVTQDECDKFCNGELKKYETKDNKTYKLFNNLYPIKHGLYKCTDATKGQVCDYTSQGGSGGSW